MDYQDSESKAVSALLNAIPKSLKGNMIQGTKGLSAEVYETGVVPEHYVGCAIDSIGTKVILAEAMGKYDTVGIDCVAMSANDLATLPQMSPFLFMNCISCQSKIQEEKITAEIVKGIVKGLELCETKDILHQSIPVQMGKGETASVQELMDGPKKGYAFDVVGSMIGFMPKESLNIEVQEGDVILALPSSGAHSNGYTDLRHHLLNGDFETREEYKKEYTGKHSLSDKHEGKTIGEWLIEPTRIYVKEMATISKQFIVVGVNNTGYGVKNLNRLPGTFRYVLDAVPEPSPLFSLMQQESGFTDEQMYTRFNMGMGFFIVARKNDAEAIGKLVPDVMLVGHVETAEKNSVVLRKDDNEIVFEGY